MTELINEIGEILKQSNELIKNPAIGGTIAALFSWLKDKIKNKSAKERLELIEQNKHEEETIAALKVNLEMILEDKIELQNQLTEKLEKVKKSMKAEGLNISTINTMNIKGNGNINFQGNIAKNIIINK